MQVLSPVGTFAIRPTGIAVNRDGVVLHVAMGAWRSRVVFDRRDLPLAAAAIGVAGLLFTMGRASAGRR